MDFLWQLFVVMTGGSVFGVLWPTLIALFKKHQPVPVFGFGTYAASSGKSLVFFLVVALVISAAVAALSMAAFLGNKDNQQALRDLGMASYFAAFTAGFSAGSLFEEPLKAR